MEGEDGAGAAAEAILGVLRAAPPPAQQRQGEEGEEGEGDGQAGQLPGDGSAAYASPPPPQQRLAPPLPVEEVTLPGGLELFCPSPSEALFIYREIWEQRCYLRHGLRLRPGATVVSAGSNIGLFELWLLLAAPGQDGGGGGGGDGEDGGAAGSGAAPPEGLLGPPGKVWAFEPVPQLADLLEENLSRHGVRNKVRRECQVAQPSLSPLSPQALLAEGAASGSAAVSI